jgi:hypothetical protein
LITTNELGTTVPNSHQLIKENTMSKTFKDLRQLQPLTKIQSEKSRGDASRRFKREQLRHQATTKLFKRELNFTTYLMHTAEKDD